MTCFLASVALLLLLVAALCVAAGRSERHAERVMDEMDGRDS